MSIRTIRMIPPSGNGGLDAISDGRSTVVANYNEANQLDSAITHDVMSNNSSVRHQVYRADSRSEFNAEAAAFFAGEVDDAFNALGIEQQSELRSISQFITNSGMSSTGVSAQVQGRWANFISGLAVNGATDVNALVQAVLRESYLETTKDLQFYAEKVRFYNELKDKIRSTLTEARNYMARHAGMNDTDGVLPMTGAEAGNLNAVLGDDQNPPAAAGAGIPRIEWFGDPGVGANGEMLPMWADSSAESPITTKAELDKYIQGLEERLNSVGDDAQLANVDLQNILQKQQQTLQMMSNISKMLHDTAMAVIRKIGG